LKAGKFCPEVLKINQDSIKFNKADLIPKTAKGGIKMAINEIIERLIRELLLFKIILEGKVEEIHYRRIKEQSKWEQEMDEKFLNELEIIRELEVFFKELAERADLLRVNLIQKKYWQALPHIENLLLDFEKTKVKPSVLFDYLKRVESYIIKIYEKQLPSA